ncbi:hypothetical protein Mgra_00001568, partial [Meloidogyne graminicola]
MFKYFIFLFIFNLFLTFMSDQSVEELISTETNNDKTNEISEEELKEMGEYKEIEKINLLLDNKEFQIKLNEIKCMNKYVFKQLVDIEKFQNLKKFLIEEIEKENNLIRKRRIKKLFNLLENLKELNIIITGRNLCSFICTKAFFKEKNIQKLCKEIINKTEDLIEN